MTSSAPYQFYWGDLHNHCDLTYGHGDPVSAFEAAREHLDFATITPHAGWADMPEANDPGLAWVLDYHTEAFARIRENWPHYQSLVKRYNEEGRFIAFVSYESHNMSHGDHVVLNYDLDAPLLEAPSIPALREKLRGRKAFITPHHMGYMRQYRGYNWQAFVEGDQTPFVEMVSRHGSAESDGGDFPYLHDMGPRTWEGSILHGLSLGHKFGIMGSTDQHAGYPGSYGDGRICVLAPSLSREAIWDALQARRIYCATGDKIRVDFRLNDAFMGEEITASRREIRVQVEGDDTIDYIEIIKNGKSLTRFAGAFSPTIPEHETIRAKIRVEVGWCRKKDPVRWDVNLRLTAGRILNITPCFRGAPYTSPQPGEEETFRTLVNRITDRGEDFVQADLYTVKNPNTVTPTTQAIVLDVEMPKPAHLVTRLNGQEFTHSLETLLQGNKSHFLDGWLSEAVQIHRAIPQAGFTLEGAHIDESPENDEDYYYLRVRQRNNQWAWTTPIWVKRP